MKSFTEGVVCPKCNSKIYMYGFLWNTGEEYYFCSECGYKFVTLWNDKFKIEMVLKESTADFSSEKLVSEIKEELGFFAYYLIENSVGGALSGLLNDSEDLEEFRKYIEEIRPKTNITKVTVGQFVDGKFITEKL